MNIKFTITKLFLLISLLVLNSLFISCEREIPLPKCEVNSDCELEHACYKKECSPNTCVRHLEAYGEDFCGKGTCITGSDMSNLNIHESDTSYECKCDENAVLYGTLCVPTCNTFSQECRDFSENGEFGVNYCNIELGHCDSKCQGEGSCEDGYYCNEVGACRVK